MPLFNRKLFTLPEEHLIKNWQGKPTQEGFLVRGTNEFFTDYDQYVKRVHFYRKRKWSCKYSGKGQLTYKEAVRKEQSIKVQLEDKFPKEHEVLIAKAVHHSTKRLEELCTLIHAQLRDSAQGGQDNGPDDAGPSSPPPSAKKKKQKEEETDGAAESKPAKAPISKVLLKAYIMENADQIGPEGATIKVWVMRPPLVHRFKLATKILDDLKKAQDASIVVKKKTTKRPAGEDVGPASATKKAKKAKADTAGPGSGEKKTAAAPDSTSKPPKIKKSKTNAEGGAKPKEPKEDPSKPLLPPVKAKTLDEVEALYGQGTLKAVLVQVFKAAHPQGLTVEGIMENAKSLGLREFEPSQRKTMQTALSTDINFVRLEKGTYSLHALHPDKIVRPKKVVEAGSEASTPLSKANLVLKQAKATLSRHCQALTKAQEAHDEAQKRVAAAKKQGSSAKGRSSDAHVPSELLTQFDIPESERDFKGDADDRKGLLEHRQKLQSRGRELEKAKQKFIKEYLSKLEAKAKEGAGDLKKEEETFKKAAAALEQVKKSVESAEKAVVNAEKKVQDEAKKSEKEAEKQKEKEAKQKEKEAKEQAKLDAKKYPIEDLDLLAQGHVQQQGPVDVALPPTLEHEDTNRLTTCLYISDFLYQFGRSLGLKSVSLLDLERMLEASQATASGFEDGAPTMLPTIYQRLQLLLLEDKRAQGDASAAEKRWSVLLSEGTWPEVLRRMVLSNLAADQHHQQHQGGPHRGKGGVDERVALAANMLTFDGADSLTVDQNLALLRFLVDEALSSERMRAVLQKRLDEVQDVTRDIRGEMAEERRRLKDLAELEREERKKKKMEEVEKEASKQQLQENGDGATKPEGDVVKILKEGPPPSRQNSEEVHPSFDLPPELQEYKGDPDDEKALQMFTKKQQQERRRMDKERNRWLANELRRGREIEAQERAAREAEKAREKEKDEATEALARAQQILEEKLDKYSVRRQPLGLDRHHRRYWYGLGGDWSKIYIEDEQGHWRIVATVDDFEVLVGSLDVRGVRELALMQALEKVQDNVVAAMKKAAAILQKNKEREERPKEPVQPGSGAKENDSNRPQPLRSSARESKQPEFYKPPAGSKSRSRSNKGPAGSSINPHPCVVGVDRSAAEGLVQWLTQLVDDADEAGVDAPEGSTWSTWCSTLIEVVQGPEAEDDHSDDGAQGKKATSQRITPGSLCKALQSKLLDLEAAVYVASRAAGYVSASTSDEEGDEEADDGTGEEQRGGIAGGIAGISRNQSSCSLHVLEVVDEEFSPTKLPRAADRLWRTMDERIAWQADVKQSMTLSRLCYCAGVLQLQAKPLLNTLKGAGDDQGGPTAGNGGSKKRKADAPAGPSFGPSGHRRKDRGLPPRP